MRPLLGPSDRLLLLHCSVASPSSTSRAVPRTDQGHGEEARRWGETEAWKREGEATEGWDRCDDAGGLKG
jgi:hypothetical protein